MKNIYSLLFLLLLVISSCTEEEIINEQVKTLDNGIVFEAIIPETTKTISSETWSSSVTEVDTVNQTMKIKTSANDLLDLRTGDIIVNENDGGYLLRIESIVQQGDDLLLSTSEASMEEAIEDADFWYDTPLTNGEVENVEMLTKGASLDFSALKTQSTKSGLSFTIGAELTDKNEIVSVGFNGSVSLLSDIRTKLKIKRFKLRNFEIGYGGKIITELTGEIKIKAEKEEASKLIDKLNLEKDIASVKFKKVVVWCGSCPILIEPVLTVSVGVRFEGVANATIGMSDELGFAAGITYLRGYGWGKYGNFDHEFSLIRPTGEIEVKAECFVTARLKYKIYKKLSPYIEFPVYGGVRAGVNTNIGFYYDLYGGVSMSAGAKMRIFGKNLINYNAELFTIEKYLNQAPEKPFSPSPSNDENVAFKEKIRVSWKGKDYNKEDELSYTVYASTDQSKVADNQKVKDSKLNYYDLTDVSPDKTVYWQVIAKDKEGKKATSAIWSFKVGSAQIAPMVPKLIAPLSSNKGIDPNAVEFKWESTDADAVQPEFTILLGTNASSMTSVFKGKISKANAIFKYASTSNLNPNTTYYWQIVSTNDNLSEESEVSSFTTSTAGAISFTDSRDSKTYAAVKIGADYWMSENLEYVGTASNNFTKQNNVVYYVYTIMDDVCPSGWHIPTTDEYDAMSAELNLEATGTLQLLDESSFSSGTNTSGFSATSTGTIRNGTIEGNEAAFYLKYPNSEAGEWPYFMYLNEQGSYWDNSDPESKLTIRCVKNK